MEYSVIICSLKTPILYIGRKRENLKENLGKGAFIVCRERGEYKIRPYGGAYRRSLQEELIGAAYK